MKGWKTITAATLSIAFGIGGVFTGIHDLNEGINLSIQGLALLGIGHKLDKSI